MPGFYLHTESRIDIRKSSIAIVRSNASVVTSKVSLSGLFGKPSHQLGKNNIRYKNIARAVPGSKHCAGASRPDGVRKKRPPAYRVSLRRLEHQTVSGCRG